MVPLCTAASTSYGVSRNKIYGGLVALAASCVGTTQAFLLASPADGWVFSSWGVDTSRCMGRALLNAEAPGRRLVMQQSTGTGTGGFPPLPPDFPPKRKKNYTLRSGQIAVRFINSSGDDDIVVPASPGDNLIAVAEKGGVKIATACASGICGTCTTDLEDRNAKSYRPGFSLIKACVFKARLLPGHDEMVLDVYRNKSSKGKLNRNLAGLSEDTGGLNLIAETLPEAMARFGPGWEDGFRPASRTPGQGPKPPTPHKLKKLRELSEQEYKLRLKAKPTIDIRDQDQMAASGRPKTGLDDDILSEAGLERMEKKAYQSSLHRRANIAKRKKVNDYLDHAMRPIAELDDLLSLSRKERMERARYFGKDATNWSEAYGMGNPAEIYREQADSFFLDRGEGNSIVRDAAYRTARQIPRYRFFGDPPLLESDRLELSKRPSEERDITPEEAAILDKADSVKRAEIQFKADFVYRDARTGREVSPSLAGADGYLRSEPRLEKLPQCQTCQGTGTLTCNLCMGKGFTIRGEKTSVCIKCHGSGKVKCDACSGVGIERSAYSF